NRRTRTSTDSRRVSSSRFHGHRRRPRTSTGRGRRRAAIASGAMASTVASRAGRDRPISWSGARLPRTRESLTLTHVAPAVSPGGEAMSNQLEATERAALHRPAPSTSTGTSADAGPAQHPMLTLQRQVGNSLINRMLAQRETDTFVAREEEEKKEMVE